MVSFITSLYIVGASTITYAFWMLLRPVLLQIGGTESEREQALNIIKQYGCSSLAHFCLLPDKSYYFSPSGQTVIAYVPKGRGAIVMTGILLFIKLYRTISICINLSVLKLSRKARTQSQELPQPF